MTLRDIIIIFFSYNCLQWSPYTIIDLYIGTGTECPYKYISSCQGCLCLKVKYALNFTGVKVTMLKHVITRLACLKGLIARGCLKFAI